MFCQLVFTKLIDCFRIDSRRLIGHGIVAWIHILYVAAGIKDRGEALKGDKDGDAHD